MTQSGIDGTRRFHKRLWVLIGIIAIILLHGAILYYLTSHVALSVVVLLGLTIMVILKLIVIKRRGLPHSVRSMFRRHFRD